MALKSIGRRALLRGLGGVAVALPALEIMGSRRPAHAAGSSVPKRHAFFDGAHCIGDRFSVSTGLQDVPNVLVPTTTGANYALTGALASLGADKYNVQSDISVISGLKIPWAVNGVVPAGGRCVEFHYGPSVFPQLTGLRVNYRAH